jgi:hypothetical protein
MAGPTLTVDLTALPRVEVFVPAGIVPAGTARLRMYRFSEGRTWLVRGGVDVPPNTAALDWEAPFGVVSTYRAECFDGSGVSLGFTDTASVTVGVTDVWVHDPLYPTVGVNLGPAGLLGITASRNVRPNPGSMTVPEGASVGAWVGQKRRGVDQMPVGLAVTSVADMDALQAMLGGYESDRVGVLCIRTPPPARIPRTFFAAVEDPSEQDRDVSWGGQRTDFVFTATEAKPPFPGLVTPLLRYKDLDASFATYAAMDAGYATYTLRDRDYAKAGVGGP